VPAAPPVLPGEVDPTCPAFESEFPQPTRARVPLAVTSAISAHDPKKRGCTTEDKKKDFIQRTS
jgi:hypothetical protein